MMPTTPLIIGHRGASYDAPENTIPAVRLAWLQRADAVEVDVHLSKDKQAIVCHDRNLSRVTGLNRLIRNMTFEQIKQLDAGRWKGDSWSDVKIPSLEQVLCEVEDRKLLIEVKSGSGTVYPIKEVLDKVSIKKSQVTLMDFNLKNVIRMRNIFPDIEIQWLYEYLGLLPRATIKRHLFKMIETSVEKGIDGLGIENLPELDEEIVSACNESGLKCYCWVVNAPERAKQLGDWGVAGVITDRPGLIRSAILSNG